jgi:hypothetical protein
MYDYPEEHNVCEVGGGGFSPNVLCGHACVLRLKAHKGNLREWFRNRVTIPLPLHNAMYYSVCVYNIIPDEACLPKQMSCFHLHTRWIIRETEIRKGSLETVKGGVMFGNMPSIHFGWMLVSSIPVELILQSYTRTARKILLFEEK